MTTTESKDDSNDTPKFQPATAADSESAKIAGKGPGSRLRNAREARNMAVSQVASLLRLDSAVIEALETDDIAKLPSATFVKGYLRSYGRLLNLDGEVLVAEYDQIAEPAADDLKVTPLGASSSAGAGRWLLLLLALVIIVGIAWYWSKPSEQPVSTETLRSEPTIEHSALTSTDTASLGAAITPEEAESGSDDQTRDEVIDELLNASNEALSEPVAESANAETTEPVATAEEPATVDAEQTIEQASPETEQAATATQAGAMMTKLTLVGIKESWVSIRDAREQRIYRDLLKPGATRTVEGQPPFLVHFGNADGVLLDIDGTTYDHQAWHKADGTARFVLNQTP
jgi:cytoskeleton protein RodZ